MFPANLEESQLEKRNQIILMINMWNCQIQAAYNFKLKSKTMTPLDSMLNLIRLWNKIM